MVISRVVSAALRPNRSYRLHKFLQVIFVFLTLKLNKTKVWKNYFGEIPRYRTSYFDIFCLSMGKTFKRYKLKLNGFRSNVFYIQLILYISKNNWTISDQKKLRAFFSRSSQCPIAKFQVKMLVEGRLAIRQRFRDETIEELLFFSKMHKEFLVQECQNSLESIFHPSAWEK